MSDHMYCEQENCNGKLALATETIWSVDPDQEPFKAGELKDIPPIGTVIDVGCHICVECHNIHDIFINEPDHKGIDPEAAEDMKEALKECNEFLDWTDFNNFDGEDWAKVPELIEKVEEALKKANLNEKAE